MNCKEVMDYMQRHLDDDLDTEEQRRMSEHLAQCSECAEMMDRLVRVDQDLANLPKVSPAFSLVDAIMPQLQQIDQELGKTRPALNTGGTAVRRWYTRRGFMRYGSLAAAAVVLGILVVNGLIDSFDESRNSMQSRSASDSAGTANTMMVAESAPSSGAGASGQAASTSSSAADAGGQAQENIARRQIAEDAASPDDAAADEKQAEVMGFDMPTEHQSKGPDVGVMEAPQGDAPEAVEVPPEASAPVRGGGKMLGAEADGHATGENNVSDEPEAAMQSLLASDAAPVVSDDGAYAASVKLTEDGMLAVHIDQIDGETIENRFVSAHQWDARTVTVSIEGWSQTEVTYTVNVDGEERSFAIDAITGAESEIE